MAAEIKNKYSLDELFCILSQEKDHRPIGTNRRFCYNGATKG
jgi:hypothetical protein